MQIQATPAGSSAQPQLKPSDLVNSARKDLKNQAADPEAGSSSKSSSIQPEEILTQIKALTEDGQFSVQFEKSAKTDEVIITVVDKATGESIRQIPAEEIFGVNTKNMSLNGSLINSIT